MKKLYEVYCPARLYYLVEAEDKDSAEELAEEEFIGLLRFLGKSDDGAQVRSSVTRSLFETSEVDWNET